MDVLLLGGKLICVSGYSAVGDHCSHGLMERGYWDLLLFVVVVFLFTFCFEMNMKCIAFA